MGIFGEPLTLGFASGEPHLAIRCSAEVLLQSEEAKSMEADSVLLGTSDVGPPDRRRGKEISPKNFRLLKLQQKDHI